LWNLEGVRSLGLLKEKENAYLGFFFFGPRGHSELSLGAI